MHPDLSQAEVFAKMLENDFDELSEDDKVRLEVCSESIEGLCYFATHITGFTKGWPVLRFLELTLLIDAALYDEGFEAQTIEMKKRMLIALDYPMDNLEALAKEA